MDQRNRPDMFTTTWPRQSQPDIIKRGDRVSWRLPDSHQRFYGRVIRRCTQDAQRSFSVREDGTGLGRIIPAKHITKECG